MPTTRVGKKLALFIKKLALFVEKLALFVEKLALFMEKLALFMEKLALFRKKLTLFEKKGALFGKKGSHLKHISAPWRMLSRLFFIVDTRQMVWLRAHCRTSAKKVALPDGYVFACAHSLYIDEKNAITN
jgi:hypothetical protein